MKNDMDFTLWSSEGVDEVEALRCLDILKRPFVVFPSELFGPNALRKPEALHALMQKHGYLPVMPKDGKRWRWHARGAEFSARWAYVFDAFLAINALRPELVGAAIRERGERRLSPTESVGWGRESVGKVGRRSAAAAGVAP